MGNCLHLYRVGNCFKPLPEPEDDLLTSLPSEIMIEIMRRLTFQNILRCMCVRKSWRHRIETIYTPKRGLPTYTSEQCLAFAYMDHEYTVCDEAFKPLLQVYLPVPWSRCVTTGNDFCFVIGSANGLLLVWNGRSNNLFVCNPMTREYAVLPRAPVPWGSDGVIFGFGVSKISGQYKILFGTYKTRSWSCYVYTLGGRSEQLWRSLVVPALDRPEQKLLVAPFLNGNLHLLTSDLKGNQLISCFDLETERFTSFSLPDKVVYYSQLRILEERLCLCSYYNSGKPHTIVIWRLNFYGDTNSWSKEYMFDNLPHGEGLVYPLKVLSNGDLLYAVRFNSKLFIYTKNTQTIMTNDLLQGYYLYSSHISFYTPSFVSLKAIGIDNVKSLEGKIIRDTL